MRIQSPERAALARRMLARFGSWDAMRRAAVLRDGVWLVPRGEDMTEPMLTALRQAARRAGLSDGYYGYPADPGDFRGEVRDVYLTSYDEGRAKNRGGKAW